MVTLVLLRCPKEKTGWSLVLGLEEWTLSLPYARGQLETWGPGRAVPRGPQSRVESLKTLLAGQFEVTHRKATMVLWEKGGFGGRENWLKAKFCHLLPPRAAGRCLNLLEPQCLPLGHGVTTAACWRMVVTTTFVLSS